MRRAQIEVAIFYFVTGVLITAEDEKLRDPEGYAAIVQLHHQMDDDQSGSIDRYESTDVYV